MWLPKKVFWSPQNIILDITNNCNLKCIMCRPQLLKERSISWSFIDFLVATKNFSPRSIAIGGTGEPLLNKNLGDMVEHLKNREIKPIINTNGTLLNTVGDWIQKVNLIKISLDAPNNTTYKTIRGNDEFPNIINNIQKIVKLQKPLIRLEFVVMSTNYREMSEMIKLVHDLKVEGVFFRLYQGMELPETSDTEFRKVPIIKQKLREAYHLGKILHVKSNLPDLIKKLDYIECRYSRKEIRDNRRKHVCLLPWFQLFIRVDGEISPCCDLLETSHKSIGNIFTDKNIWNSDKMKDLRILFATKTNYNLYKSCQTCEYLDWKQILKWIKLVPSWL